MAHKFDSFWEIGDLAVTKSRFGNLSRLRLRLLGLLGFGRKILNLTILGENFARARFVAKVRGFGANLLKCSSCRSGANLLKSG